MASTRPGINVAPANSTTLAPVASMPAAALRFDAIAGHTHGPTFHAWPHRRRRAPLQQHGGGRLRLGRQRSRGEEETDGKGTVEVTWVIISRFAAGGSVPGIGAVGRPVCSVPILGDSISYILESSSCHW